MRREDDGLKVTRVIVAFATSSFVMAGCQSGAADPSLPGSDRDGHGCIASAGYSWCARTDRCERPWELAEQRGFDNQQEAFERYCEASGE